jgi:hypothetical protein
MALIASIDFTPMPGRAAGELVLYRADAPGLYFLLADNTGSSPAPPHLDVPGCWQRHGAYFFCETDPGSDLKALQGQLKLDQFERGLAWLARSTEGKLTGQLLPMLLRSSGDGTVAMNTPLAFGNVELLLSSRCSVAVAAGGLEIGGGSNVNLQRKGRRGQQLLPPEGDLTIEFAPPASGRIAFSAQWDAYRLFAQLRDNPEATSDPRGGELRYYQAEGGGGGEAARRQAYPLFAAVSRSGSNPYLDLDVELDPLAPFDGARTRMRFKTGSKPGLSSAFGTTPTGDQVKLRPLTEDEDERAGFYLARRPDENGAPAVYLAPLGPFELEFEAGESRMMCGLSGLEFLQAATGDRLTFVPGQPAFAPLAEGGESPPPLEPACTTSWVSYSPGATATAADGGNGRFYFSQPDASTSYGSGVVPAGTGKGMKYPAAVASRVRDLSAGSPAPFPMVLYGGAQVPLEEAGAKAPTAAQLTAFEGAVLAPARGALLRRPAAAELAAAGSPEPPPSPPVFANAEGKALEGGATSTPQGFVVELNDGKTRVGEVPPAAAGTWREVLFARSEKEWLKLEAEEGAGYVDPWLATSLVKDQLFLVVSDWQKLPGMSGVLSVGGFDFEMAPKAEDQEGLEAAKSVMVFKFSTSRSLEDLIGDSESWYQRDHFVGDRLADTKTILSRALEVAREAEGEKDDPFGRFREIAADPGWTGLLTFNGLVPGTGMPPELQMLYAGLEEPLRAHHFGVELNRVKREADGSAPEIVESSLFGVIHYSRKPPEPPKEPPETEFIVRELNVAIRNSAVTEFHSKILVRANRLFGREVTLVSDPGPETPNAIELVGQYQRHGSVGTVSFVAPASGTFEFAAPPAARVLSGMEVAGASLVPVESVPEGDETKIVAKVTLEGSLAFAADPIPGLTGLDLFSYGRNSQGAGISGFGLLVSAVLRKDGSKEKTTVTTDLSTVVLSDNRAALRPEGMVSRLPLTLKGLAYDKEGLDASKLGALPVNIVELGSGNWVTAKPQYALRFDLPLGSLGGLADSHASLDATLVLGWGPSTYSPDDDAIGVFVQLPFFSAGAFGFDVQGLLKTTFGDATLMQLKEPPTYVVLFNNVALSVLGFTFPPRVITDFILFAGPGTGGRGNLGWSLAAVEPAKKEQAAIEAGG